MLPPSVGGWRCATHLARHWRMVCDSRCLLRSASLSIRREPALAQLGRDLLRLFYLAIVVASILFFAMRIPSVEPLWMDVTRRVLAGIFGELLAFTLLRTVLPRPHQGAHIVGWNRAYLSWLFSLPLADVGLNRVMRFPFWFLHSTRVLFLNALGARVSWQCGFHADTSVREPALIEVGAGSQLEPNVALEVSVHSAGRVRVGRISIGEGCLINAHAVLMPGVTVAHEARIEPGALLGENVRIGVGARVGAGACIGPNTEVGSYASVGVGCVIGHDVRLGDRARVLPGSVVVNGTVIGEREIWSGHPARHRSGRATSLASDGPKTGTVDN
jgi:acetyltransferase-like isoleucine patch superfamily enzyme